MCRFVGYLGEEILLGDILTAPENSLIHQSFGARERREPLNGDGFGVGWYVASAFEPALFKSITPAWNNQNLLDLASHLGSSCFFAHIRAASPGMIVAESNCHPFRCRRYLWMHNGSVAGFRAMRRKLCESLPDELYDAIQGTTDSEHAFAVFMNIIGDPNASLSAHEMGEAMLETIAKLQGWAALGAEEEPSLYNFAVTDGKSMASVRYVSSPLREPISLYYSRPGAYRFRNGEPMIVNGKQDTGVILASERLTSRPADWIRVAPNHVLTIDQDLNAKMSLMPGF